MLDSNDTEGPTEPFSELEDTVLDALALGMTHYEAAELVGRNAKFVQRALRRDEFRVEMQRRRAAHLDSLVGQLRALGPLAVEVHREAMTDPAAPLTARLRAATSVLAFVSRLREHAQLEARVVELESKSLSSEVER